MLPLHTPPHIQRMSSLLNFFPCRVSRGVRSRTSGLILTLTLAVLLFPSPSSASTTIGKVQSNNIGLVGYWPLDGKTTNWATGKTNDLSGHGNTGQLINMSTTTSPVPGKIGQALKFNGSNQYILASSLSGFGTMTSATFSAWVYSKANQNSYTAISFSRTGAYGGLQISGAGTNMLTFGWNGPVSEWNANTGLTIPNNKWTFVAGVITPTGATVYMNGATYTQSQTNPSHTFTAWTIGRDPEGDPGRYWNGSLDDVRIYSRALSANEIKQLYNLGSANVAHSNTTALSTGLVGYWTFNGGATHWNTGKVDDVSGHGNTGQLINMSTTTSPVAGKIGQALKFRGGSTALGGSYISVPDSTNLSATTTFSFAAWLKPSLTGTRAIMTRNSATHQFDIQFSSGDNLYVRQYNGFAISSVAAVHAGVWTHAVITYDGSNNVMTFYINGAFVERDSLGGALLVEHNPIKIGADTGQQDFLPFSGLMDDVRIYNRALSASEVRELYSMGRVRL